MSLVKKILGEEKMEKLVNSKVYRFGVDAVAMNLFSLVYVLNDKFMGDKDWSEAWATRLTAVVGNTLTGRPYGIFRDWMLKKFNVEEDSSFFKKYAVETLTFAIGQSPLYAMYLAGGDIAPEIIQGSINLDPQQIMDSYQNVDPEAIGSAVTSLTFLAPLLGRPQGWTYDRVREQGGLESAYEQLRIADGAIVESYFKPGGDTHLPIDRKE
ncbi:MAG: L-alanine exporter AlaE [Candidatus Nanoarchaeia archaeon]